MVVGDSGAHSNPLLGEGIRHVIPAARRAAPIAAAALARPGVVPASGCAPGSGSGRRTRGSSWGLTMRANRYVAAWTTATGTGRSTLMGALPAERSRRCCEATC